MKYVNGEPMPAKRQLRELIKKRLDKHLEVDNPSAVILLDLAPAITCLEAGHERQPRWWLSRYRRTVWRCERCGYWWRTEWRASFVGHDWHWTVVLADDPVTYSPRGWNS